MNGRRSRRVGGRTVLIALCVVVSATCASDDGGDEASTPPVTDVPDTASTSCCAEGAVGVAVYAKSGFDPVVRNADAATWADMRRRYDEMIVFAPFFDRYLDEYPDAVVYQNLYAIYTDPARDPRGTEHPDWILRNAAGDPVYIDWGCTGVAGCPQYAADAADPAFAADLVARLAELGARGYGGVLLDDVNLVWRFADRRGGPETPIDPRSGLPMTIEDWKRDVVALVERIRESLPDMTIVHNSLWFADTPGLDDPLVDRQIRAADLILLERGANDAGLVGGIGRFGFRTFLDSVDRVHELGANVILLDETGRSDAAQWFNLAAALLANDGGDLVSTEVYARMAPDTFWEGFDTDLGAARGSRTLIGTVHRRDFAGGLVLLNEPEGVPVEVEVTPAMTTGAGDTVERLALGPREAVVLEGGDVCVDLTIRTGSPGAALSRATGPDWCPDD